MFHIRLEYAAIILMMGLVTYLTRVAMLAYSNRVAMPQVIQRSLKYIPAAILSALIFPGVFTPQGRLSFSPANPYLLAAVVTTAIVILTKKPVLGIVLGIGAMILLRALGPGLLS